jgi:hypothetical protein
MNQTDKQPNPIGFQFEPKIFSVCFEDTLINGHKINLFLFNDVHRLHTHVLSREDLIQAVVLTILQLGPNELVNGPVLHTKQINISIFRT